MEKNRSDFNKDRQEVEAVAVLHAYGSPLSTVSSYKYLGSMIMAPNDDWVAVILNLGEVLKQ